MNSGMYSALSGNLSAMRRLDVLSNNLANSNTPGFKGDQIQFESVLANATKGSATDSPVFGSERFSTDFSQGPLRQSGNPMDMAISGEGFFVVRTPEGLAYTRQGNFRLDAVGKLVTGDGFEVQGGGAAINVAGGGRIDIDDKGVILVDGNQVGKLDIVDFPKPYALTKVGSALFMPADPAIMPGPTTSSQVNQGFLEDSNVNVIVEMARLIETSRYFESCQKAVRSYDDIASKAANDLGRL
jgi:flagellar basal-body rod protein FlgG